MVACLQRLRDEREGAEIALVKAFTEQQSELRRKHEEEYAAHQAALRKAFEEQFQIAEQSLRANLIKDIQTVNKTFHDRERGLQLQLTERCLTSPTRSMLHPAVQQHDLSLDLWRVEEHQAMPSVQVKWLSHIQEASQ